MADSSDSVSIAARLISHVALPPYIPDRQEDQDLTSELEQAMIRILSKASVLLRDKAGDLTADYNTVFGILQSCKQVNAGGFLKKDSLLAGFQCLENNPLILHVTEQNAGLVIRRDQG